MLWDMKATTSKVKLCLKLLLMTTLLSILAVHIYWNHCNAGDFSAVNRGMVNYSLSRSLSLVVFGDARVPTTHSSPSWVFKSEFRSAEVEERVDKCMRMANLDSEPLLMQAKENARYFYDEYRKAIPEEGLSGYRSHCWRQNYFTIWIGFGYSIAGVISNVTLLPQDLLNYWPYRSIFNYINYHFPNKTYESEVVCLPNVFVIGFEKCGSTFLFDFMNKLVSVSTEDWGVSQVAKETQFWVRFEPYEDAKVGVPKVDDLGRYLINFIPGIDRIVKLNRTDVLLVDGTPNYITEWPVFTKTENNMSNYCLLPAALPTLLPNSKYVAIMRNPIDMVYSNFWWSCTKNSINISEIAARGPDIFHERIVSKMHTFNDCMRDESVPSISSPCELLSMKKYSSCIKRRLHLLDKCSASVFVSQYSSELPLCGDSSLSLGLFYVHVHKWLSLVGREDLLLLTLEELNQHPREVARSLMQFLNVERRLAIGERTIEALVRASSKNTQDKVDYKMNHSLAMREDTKLALEIFYHPFNELLADLLGSDKFMWF